MCVPVGNATADTELSFEYGVKKTKSKQSQASQEGLTDFLTRTRF